MTATERAKKAPGGATGFALVALLCAGSAAFVTVKLTRGLRPEKKLPVVVATRAISAAETIPEDALVVQMWPKDRVPEGAVMSIKQLYAEGNKPIAATGILANEAVVKARLASESRGTAMATLVRQGFRAVAVKMDNNVVRAGLVYPGAQVDVMGTMKDTVSRETTTRMIVENVRVLAVEAHTDVETFKPKSHAAESGSRSQNTRDAVVTVELTPEQAEFVFLAEREGHVDLALRNAEDEVEVNTNGATPSMIKGALVLRTPLDAPEPPPIPGAPAHAKARGGRRKGVEVMNNKSAAARIASDRPAAEPQSATIETYNAKKH